MSLTSAAAAVFDVHIIGSDGKELRCVRVPVSGTSTVRQLASECLSRFVTQSRFIGGAIDVVADDVTASGCSLFYNDVVTAVVRPSETVAVHLRNVTVADIQPRRIAMLTNQTEVSPADIAAVVKALDATETSMSSTAAAKRDRDAEAAVTVAPVPVEDQQGRRTQPAPVAPVAANKRNQPVPAATKQQPGAAELGWGAESHKTYPENYVTDPDALGRAIRRQKKDAAAAAAAAAKKAAAAQQQTAAAASTSSMPATAQQEAKLKPRPSNTNPLTLSKLELYCDAEVIEVPPPSVTHVARQLNFA